MTAGPPAPRPGGAGGVEMVWYVAYGSNLLAERFVTYLEGGRPDGRAHAHQGARDRTRWRTDRPVEVPHRLHFAGTSRWWGGGGVALVSARVGGQPTRGRAYLITREQFQDVLAQESGREVGHDVDLEPALRDGRARVSDGPYDLVVRVGEDGGWPMLTFTRWAPLASLPFNAPSAEYASCIVAGLRQCHGFTEPEARTYLAERFSAGP